MIFLFNDISRAQNEIRELKEIDKDLSGTIDPNELMELRQKTIKVSGTEKMMELFTTHPHMLKRIKQLADLA